MGKRGNKGNKKNRRLPASVSDLPGAKAIIPEISEKEAAHLDLIKNASAHVNMKYYRRAYQCFSEWTKAELESLSKFITKLPQYTWTQIYQSGGRGGNKAGFGYTVHSDIKKLPDPGWIQRTFSPDITFFELRVTQEARVHGFRMKSAFFLVWLDRGHDIYPA